MNKPQSTIFALLFIALSLILVAGCNIPFLPRLEIDSFSMDNELIETMEVKGVIYARANNPKAANDPEAPASIWVPASAYHGGGYEACTIYLPEPQNSSEIAAGDLPEDDSTAPAPGPDNEFTTPQPTAEAELADNIPAILPLRRRALLFPSHTSIIRPDIASLLSLELEAQLPLRVDESQDQKLREEGRLLLSRDELTRAVRKWLKNQQIPAPFQFIIFLSTSSGSNFKFYTCTWIDAQTGDRVASFTFRANLKGELFRPLVPAKPVPLQRLVSSTGWWCKIKSRKEIDNYILDAGHRSDLNYGRTLQVFRKATPVKDPQNKNRLGFLFSDNLGEVHIVDFFAADGSLARARTPLSGNFDHAWAVEIVEIE